MIVILQKPATAQDINKAKEEYKSYIKVTMDIEQEVVAIGGEYHFDAEQKLLAMGCRQENIWGGGIDLTTKRIDANAMINIRPKQNEATEIMDSIVKEKFVSVVRKYLPDYVQQ